MKPRLIVAIDIDETIVFTDRSITLMTTLPVNRPLLNKMFLHALNIFLGRQSAHFDIQIEFLTSRNQAHKTGYPSLETQAIIKSACQHITSAQFSINTLPAVYYALREPGSKYKNLVSRHDQKADAVILFDDHLPWWIQPTQVPKSHFKLGLITETGLPTPNFAELSDWLSLFYAKENSPVIATLSTLPATPRLFQDKITHQQKLPEKTKRKGCCTMI